MKIMIRTTTVRPAAWAYIAAACILAASPAWAQDTADQRSGVSHPSTAPITIDTPETAAPVVTPPAKPSAAIPATPPTSDASTVYGAYVPYKPAGSVTSSAPAAQSFDPDANIVTQSTAGQSERRLLAGPANNGGPVDEDAGIVTHVPSVPGEIPEGSLIKADLQQQLSTLTTTPGTKFTASVSEPVLHNGQVIIPVGSILEGRVSWLRSGKRIGGSAAIHLDPRFVTLPDGTQYILRAQVIDSNQWDNTKVDSEGTIMRRENRKRNVGIMSLTTGGAMAAGAMVAGVPGALIGAGVGAGVSTVIWLKQDRQAVLPKDLGLVFSLTEPMDVTPSSSAFAPAKPLPSGGE